MTENLNINEKLELAIVNKKYNEVKQLIKDGADVNHRMDIIERDCTGYILNKAIMCSTINIVKILIENGADINKKDSKGRTALFYAFYDRNIEMIIYLLNYSYTQKINLLNETDNEGNTILMNCLKQTIINYIKLAEFIIIEYRGQIDFEKTDSEDKTLYNLILENERISENTKNILKKMFEEKKEREDREREEKEQSVQYNIIHSFLYEREQGDPFNFEEFLNKVDFTKIKDLSKYGYGMKERIESLVHCCLTRDRYDIVDRILNDTKFNFLNFVLKSRAYKIQSEQEFNYIFNKIKEKYNKNFLEEYDNEEYSKGILYDYIDDQKPEDLTLIYKFIENGANLNKLMYRLSYTFEYIKTTNKPDLVDNIILFLYYLIDNNKISQDYYYSFIDTCFNVVRWIEDKENYNIYKIKIDFYKLLKDFYIKCELKDKVDKRGNPYLWCMLRDINIISFFTCEEWKLQHRNNEGDNIINIVVDRGGINKINIISTLIGMGADINNINNQGKTPFLQCLIYRMFDLATFLLENYELNLIVGAQNTSIFYELQEASEKLQAQKIKRLVMEKLNYYFLKYI